MPSEFSYSSVEFIVFPDEYCVIGKITVVKIIRLLVLSAKQYNGIISKHNIINGNLFTIFPSFYSGSAGSRPDIVSQHFSYAILHFHWVLILNTCHESDDGSFSNFKYSKHITSVVSYCGVNYPVLGYTR
jgi:hypothetical protein